jgi:hypothetical protein
MKPSNRLNLAGRALLSFLSFNLGWWVCALGPTYGYPWAGPALLPLWVGMHLYFSPTRLGEGAFFVVLATVGFVIDTVLLRLQVFQIGTEIFTPAWLVAMWVLLGLTFESMLPMRRHWALLCLAGVLSGPLSYIFAEAVDILGYSQPKWLMLSVHGVFWAGLLPLLFALRDWCIHLSLHRKRSH